MTCERKILAAMLTSAALVAPSAAWAAVDTTLVFEGPNADSIGANQLSFPPTQDGTVQVRAVADDDRNDGRKTFVVTFPGSGSSSTHVTYPGSDGRPRTSMLPPAGPGQIITVNTVTGIATAGPGSGAPSLGGPVSGIPNGLRSPTIMAGINYTTFGAPRSGVGVTNIFDPNGEEFIQRIGGRINFPTYGGDVLFPAGRFVGGFGFHAGKGNNREFGQVAPGGANSGVVFPVISEVFGTGFSVGSLGVDINSRTSVKQNEFYGKFGMPIPCDNGKSSITPYARFAHSTIDYRQQSDFSTPAYPGQIGSTLSNRLKTQRTSFGIGGYYNRFLSDEFALGLNLEGSVNFDRRKFTSTQTVDIFGTTDTVSVDEKRNNTSFGFAGEVSGTYYFSPRVGINLYARYQHDGGFGVFDNLLSGNQSLNGEKGSFRNGKIDELQFGARAVLTFGGHISERLGKKLQY